MANDMADVLHDAYAEYCDGRVDWQQMVVAVHSFLGAEKPLKKNAVAKLVAALRKAVRACIDVHRSATQNPALTCAGWCPSYTGACLYWKALRAAGVEVEDGE